MKNFLLAILALQIIVGCKESSTNFKTDLGKDDSIQIKRAELENQALEVQKKQLDEKERELDKRKLEEDKKKQRIKDSIKEQDEIVEASNYIRVQEHEEMEKETAELNKIAKKERGNIEEILIRKLKEYRCSWGCDCKDLTYDLLPKGDPIFNETNDGYDIEYNYYISSYCATNDKSINFNCKSKRSIVNTSNGFMLTTIKSDEITRE